MRSKLLIVPFFLALLVISIKPIFGKDYYKNICERENSDSISIDAIFALDSLYLSRKKTSPSVEDLLATKDVEIKIIPTSIKIVKGRSDSDFIKFEYQIENKTSSNLYIMNFRPPQLLIPQLKVMGFIYVEANPTTYLLILDEHNETPNRVVFSFSHPWSILEMQALDKKDNMTTIAERTTLISHTIQSQKPTLETSDKGRSIKLFSKSNIIYEDSAYIGNVDLKDINYKLSLQYFSFRGNESTESTFKDRQELYPELKNYKLFQGMINSDTVAFQLPHPIIPKSLKYEDFPN